MKKEIRERMIAMSYNKRLQWKVGIVLWAILVLGLIVRIVKGYSRPLFFFDTDDSNGGNSFEGFFLYNEKNSKGMFREE